MFRVAPTRLVCRDVLLSAFPDADRPCRIKARLPVRCATRLYRINAVVALTPTFCCPGAGVSKADSMQRPHAHPPWSAVEHEPEHPIFCPILCYAQIKPTAVCIHSGLLCLFDFEGRKPANDPCHEIAIHKNVHKLEADCEEQQRTCKERKSAKNPNLTGYFCTVVDVREQWRTIVVAEREGFEPPIRLPVCRISSAVHSTTLPPLRISGRRVVAVGFLAKGSPQHKAGPPFGAKILRPLLQAAILRCRRASAANARRASVAAMPLDGVSKRPQAT
jgi:hypothetical protein